VKSSGWAPARLEALFPEFQKFAEVVIPVCFPSYRFNAAGDMRLVNDPAELEALGEGWADTPAAFEQKEESPAAAESEVEIEDEDLDEIDEPEQHEGGKEPETDPPADEAPKADPPAGALPGRCACGQYSLKYAKKQGHVCEAPK
jgi:hypothetical protein